MQAFVLLLLGALALFNLPALAVAAETAVEVPLKGVPTEGPKLPGNDSGELKASPDPNELNEVGPESSLQFPGAVPQAVFRNGCIFRPGGGVTINLRARGLVLYRVVPSRFFDVTMRVTYVNIRGFFVDRFFAGGAEAIRILGPAGFRPVSVRIAGFRGSTGCFAFSATP